MKKREMCEEVSPLSWAAIIELLEKNQPDGYTNQELADHFGVEYARVSGLTRVMYENGALSKMQIGRTAGITFYFLPVEREEEAEQD